MGCRCSDPNVWEYGPCDYCNWLSENCERCEESHDDCRCDWCVHCDQKQDECDHPRWCDEDNCDIWGDHLHITDAQLEKLRNTDGI